MLTSKLSSLASFLNAVHENTAKVMVGFNSTQAHSNTRRTRDFLLPTTVKITAFVDLLFEINEKTPFLAKVKVVFTVSVEHLLRLCHALESRL